MSAFVEKLPSAPMVQMLRALREQYPPLTAEEESELILRWQGNRERMNELLVLHNASLLTGWAKSYAMKYRDMDVDDMIQCGFIGLWRAAKKFEPERGLRFSTYAGYHAQSAMGYATRLRSYLVDRRSVSLNYKLESKDGEEKQELIDVVQGRIVDGFKETSLAEWLESRDSLAFAEKVIEETRGVCKRDKEIYLRKAKGETLDMIGADYGVSRERARQIVEKVVGHVRLTACRADGHRWQTRTRTTNWDRIGTYCSHSQRIGNTEYRTSHDIVGLIYFERYKLGLKGHANITSVRSVGPTLTSNGFTARKFTVKGRDFVFKDGKWIPAQKEESYGYEEDGDGKAKKHAA